MNLEVEGHEGELKALRKFYTTFRHIDLAEKLGNIYFICGELGVKDDNNMPQKILVCPAYGVDFSYVYEYNGVITGPEG